MKRIISFVLSIVMLLSCVTAGTVSAFAEDNQCGSNAYYFYNESTGVLSIKGTGAIYDYSYSSYKTTAPWKNIYFTELNIAEGITSIGSYDFYGLSFESVTLPKSLTSIGYYAFQNCYNLYDVKYNGTEDDFDNNLYISSSGNSYLIYADWTYHTHDYATEVSKASVGTPGLITETCECGDVVTTTIAAPKTMTLSKSSYTYNGESKNPSVTVKDTNSNVIDSENYTVTYPADCVSAGKHTVKITFKNNYEGEMSADFTISPTVGNNKTLYVGETYKIPAKGAKSYSFKSSNTKIATVNSDGVVTAKGKGTAIITVTVGGASKTVKVTVKVPTVKINKTKATIKIAKTVQLKLTATPKGGKVSWKTSDKKIATVNSKGVVRGVNKGTVTITGTYTYKGHKYTKTCKVKVESPKVTLNKTKASVYIKKTVQLKASVYPKGSKITWSSSNKKIATVSSNGKVTGIKKGTVNITAKYTYKGQTYKAVCKVTVKNPELSDKTFTICNTCYFKLKVKGGSGKIKWSSSNSKIAYVKNNGEVHGLKAGTCNIYAVRNGVKLKCKVTVSRYYPSDEAYYLRDLGAMFGVEQCDWDISDGTYIYEYKYDAIDKAAGSKDWLYEYTSALVDDNWHNYDDYYEGDTRYITYYGYLGYSTKMVMITYNPYDNYIMILVN